MFIWAHSSETPYDVFIIVSGHLGAMMKKSMSDIKENRNTEVKIPNITIVPERTLVNFITLAESVALAPMEDFRTSSDGFSTLEVDIFNLFSLGRPNGLLVL